MSSKAAALLVATSTGRYLAEELSVKGSYTSLIEGPDGVPKALLGVNGQSVLNHWLTAIKLCPRLTPDKVFVLCNESNVGDVRVWASDSRLSGGGFLPEHVLSNGSEDSLGLGADIATFLAAAPSVSGASLVVMEADAMCGPGFGLARIVEHAVVRGKDTLTYMSAPEGMPLEGAVVVALEAPGSAAETTQRVAGVSASPGGIVDALTLVAILAPVAVLRPDTLERVAAAAAAGTCSPSSSLGDLVAQLQPGNVAHPPMYAMPVDCFFRLTDFYNVQLTSNFHAYYNTEKAGAKGDAAKALEAARRLADLQAARTIVGGSLAGAVRLIEATEAARGPEPCVDAELRRVYRAFWRGWALGDRHYDLGASAAPGSGGVTAFSGRSEARTIMPLRFVDATTRRHTTKAQHPVYTTSNSTYGGKTPAQSDMPPTYTAASQHFTKTFPLTPSKNTGLITANTMSKVHRALDDF